MAKRGSEWYDLTGAVVAYDHARHAPFGDVINLDFVNSNLEPGARAGVALTLDSAKEVLVALDRAIAAAEFEEGEGGERESSNLAASGKGCAADRRAQRLCG